MTKLAFIRTDDMRIRFAGRSDIVMTADTAAADL